MLLVDPCFSSEKITAFLTDGRQVTGLVDARTNTERLWVRREEVNLEVVSGFVWQVVADVRKDGQSLEPVEIQAMAVKDKPTTQRFQKRVESPSDLPSIVAVKMPRPITTTEPVIKSLVVRACLAQWDNVPQSDGTFSVQLNYRISKCLGLRPNYVKLQLIIANESWANGPMPFDW